MGTQARQAHQEDVFTARTDTQNELLCRVAPEERVIRSFA
jgi:hypothetical protein